MSTDSRFAIGELHTVLDEVLAVDPIYLTTAEKQSASLGLAQADARLQAARLRLLATSDDIAETTGDRSTASWLASATRDDHGTVRRNAALAGAVNLAQARVIVEALDALPQDLGDDLRV